MIIMNMTMRGSSLWYSTVICNILIYITYDIQHDLSPWELGHGTKNFYCQIVFKLCHNNCFLFCKDENTSLKLNQMLSEPGLLPVPLSMLTESPLPHRARVTVSVTDHWPVSQISQLIFYLQLIFHLEMMFYLQLIFYIDHSVSSGANTLLMLTDSATNYVWGWQFQWIIAALTNITTDICGWLLFPTLQFTSFLVTHLL